MKKRLFTLALASVAALGLASCGGNTDPTTTTTTAPATTTTTAPATTTPAPATTTPAPATTTPATTTPDAAKTYTLNDFLGSTTSLKWNPLTWETNDDSAVLGYLSMGFYDYWVNDEKDGYVVVPEMAADLPTDVTSQYVGSYGIEEGEKNKAFEIKLNQKATWEDGTAIKADDYIYSMQQQLDGDQMNRRADSYYGGDFSIVKAQDYLYSEKVSYTTAMVSANYGDDEYVDPTTFTTNEAGQLVCDGKTMALNLASGGNWGSNGLTAYYNAGYFSKELYDTLKNAEDETGFVVLTPTTLRALQDVIAVLHGKADVDAYAAEAGAYAYKEWEEMCFYSKVNAKTEWDEVGLFKLDDYTIVIVIENELENPDFYLPYHLSSTWLVKKDAYEACWTQTADGKRVNTYNTTVETTHSYGPYMLTYFEADKQLKFARNTNWYGYSDEAHKGKYQTTNIVLDIIADHKTALLAFASGKIDGVGMQSADLDTYGGSKYLMYTPESYTTKITFNTDSAKLAARESEGVNKRMLLNENFRHALSLSFNRSEFVNQYTAAAAPGYGLFNYLYQYFNAEGSTSSYRDTDAAKDALCRVYGVEYGAGKEYETLDEAYAAMTGYDVAAAKALFDKAFDEAVEAGYYNGTDKILLRFSMYQADDIYKNMFKFFQEAIAAATTGTKLEGKIELEFYVDADYYETMYAGGTDIIYSTWGGAQYGTFGMMSNVYVDDYTGGGNQMEIGFNTDLILVKLTVNDTEYEYSLKAWADWLNAKNADIDGVVGKASSVDPDDRAAILAELEYQYLSKFVAVPLYYRQSASLVSAKVNYAAPKYIDLVGHGGLSQITYNYDDAAWAKFVAEHNNDLTSVYAG